MWQPFIWDACHQAPRATYPGTMRTTSEVPLFGLASGGVYLAIDVTTNAVRSYRHLFTLTDPGGFRRCIFCGTFHGLTPSRRYLAPCPMKPGLSSIS